MAHTLAQSWWNKYFTNLGCSSLLTINNPKLPPLVTNGDDSDVGNQGVCALHGLTLAAESSTLALLLWPA